MLTGSAAESAQSRRASAINRHGSVTVKTVREIVQDLGALVTRFGQLEALMRVVGLDENEEVKIDGARKLAAAKESAESYYQMIQIGLAQHQLAKVRRARLRCPA